MRYKGRISFELGSCPPPFDSTKFGIDHGPIMLIWFYELYKVKAFVCLEMCVLLCVMYHFVKNCSGGATDCNNIKPRICHQSPLLNLISRTSNGLVLWGPYALRFWKLFLQDSQMWWRVILTKSTTFVNPVFFAACVVFLLKRIK
jgi:hypothetical protein